MVAILKPLSLPPYEVAFYENVLRAHLAAAIMKGSINPDPSALSPTEHGWYTLPSSENIFPRVTPDDTAMAPDA